MDALEVQQVAQRSTAEVCGRRCSKQHDHLVSVPVASVVRGGHSTPND
jgi:hypothetical protein